MTPQRRRRTAAAFVLALAALLVAVPTFFEGVHDGRTVLALLLIACAAILHGTLTRDERTP